MQAQRHAALRPSVLPLHSFCLLALHLTMLVSWPMLGGSTRSLLALSDSQVRAVQAPISGGSSVMSLEWRDRWSRRRRLEMVSGSVAILLECRSAQQGGHKVRRVKSAEALADPLV